jgi:hypothetical protein
VFLEKNRIKHLPKKVEIHIGVSKRVEFTLFEWRDLKLLFLAKDLIFVQ